MSVLSRVLIILPVTPAGLISFLVNKRLMVDQAASVSGPCLPGQACELGLTTPCLQYWIRTELGTKPCILLCLHSVYISDKNRSTRRAKH